MTFALSELKDLFLQEWDPLGLAGREGTENHYDPYARQVLEMLRVGCDELAVANYFDSVVTAELFLTSNLERDRAIARRAVEICTVP